MNIREHLAQGKPFLLDGAMGTLFALQPGRALERCEAANLEHPEEISAIHRAYLEAGSQGIQTNTFSIGTDFAQGDRSRGSLLIEAGCRLAREAVEPYKALVFADLGPVPSKSAVLPAEVYQSQAEVFLAQGMTHFIVETLASADGIPELARYLKERNPEAFLLISFAVGWDGVTSEGFSGSDLLHRMDELPEVDAVGLNCMSGPHHLLQFLRRLDWKPKKALSVMPNSGYPTVLGRRTVYQGRPAYFAQKMAQIAQEGALLLGGCCGTTPAHIAALAEELSRPQREVPEVYLPVRRERVEEENPFWEKLQAGKRVYAVELDPPLDDRIDPFLEDMRALQKAGIDILTIADCPVGRSRADSSLLACKLKREYGMETLPHMTCRDRNRNAAKALLLGLSIEGIHNILLVTGDPIPSADRDEVKSVFHFNSRKFARYVRGLNEEVFHTPFRVFGALNVNAANFSIQLSLAREKEENGMVGFLTQPVLSRKALENLKQARETLHGKILGGIYPIVSYRNACFLNNEISGIEVCEEIISLYEGKDRAESENIAVRISVPIAEASAPYTDGFYLMTPFRRVGLIQRILEQIRGIP